MISLNESLRDGGISGGYKELLDAIFSQDPYQAGTSCGGLHPDHITETIKHILYVEKYKRVDFSVSLEDDGFHLHIAINKKEK